MCKCRRVFGKWFASTYTGSMLGAGADVFAVWSWVIANAGPKGILEINPALLAAMIGEPVEAIETALAFLQAPDPRSRSDSEQGPFLTDPVALPSDVATAHEEHS